jgi:hypothetical protein
MLRRRLMMTRKKEEEEIKLIRFTIEGIGYFALSNMTWGEWVSSKYNTDGFIIDESDNSIMIGSYWVHTGNDYVYTSEVIEEDYNYLLVG